jgi:hypothetical protein
MSLPRMHEYPGFRHDRQGNSHDGKQHSSLGQTLIVWARYTSRCAPRKNTKVLSARGYAQTAVSCPYQLISIRIEMSLKM